MERADYDADTEHTLNPQGITVNGKSRQTEAVSREIQKREGEVQEATGAPFEGGAPLRRNPNEPVLYPCLLLIQ